MRFEHRLSNSDEIVNNTAPTHPFFKSGIAFVQTAVEVAGPFDNTDAAFDTRLKTATKTEPFLPFVFDAFWGSVAWLGQTNVFYAGLASRLFVSGRIDPPVG